MKKTCSDIQASETLQSFLRNAKCWIVCPGCLIEQISVIDEKSLTHVLYWTGEGRNLHSHVSLDRPFPPHQSLLRSLFYFHFPHSSSSALFVRVKFILPLRVAAVSSAVGLCHPFHFSNRSSVHASVSSSLCGALIRLAPFSPSAPAGPRAPAAWATGSWLSS